jgi:hypothetical protein
VAPLDTAKELRPSTASRGANITAVAGEELAGSIATMQG